MSSEFPPVRTLEDLYALDPHEIEQGYFYGLNGNPEPSPHVVSRSFMHGWRNGATDAGARAQDEHQAALRLDYAVRIPDDQNLRFH